MKLMADMAASKLQAKGIIRKEEVAIYHYGVDALFTSLLELMSILLLASIVGNLVETILFFLAFIPLRIYAGGYHASTRSRCYLLSLAVYGLFSLALTFVPVACYLPLILGASVLTAVTVLRYAPIVHENRKVSLENRERCRKVSIGLCAIEIIILVTLQCIFKESTFIFALFLGMFSETLSMLAVKKR